MKHRQKHFYHSVVSIESLLIEFENYDFSPVQKKELVEIAERTLHHSILDLVLSELKEEDKQLFLHHHASEDHDTVWKLLNGNISNIETKIKSVADKLSHKLHSDLKKIK